MITQALNPKNLKLKITVLLFLRLIKETTGLRFAASIKLTAGSWVRCGVDESTNPGVPVLAEKSIQEMQNAEGTSERADFTKSMVLHLLDFSECKIEPSLSGQHPYSHIWIPIITSTGLSVGFLYGLDPTLHATNKFDVISTLELFASLLATYLDIYSQLEYSQSKLNVSEDTGRLRENFLAVLAHDLKTPVCAVLMGVALLKDQMTEKKSGGLLTAIESSAHRILLLIDEVLDFSRCRLGGEFPINKTLIKNLFEELVPVIDEVSLAHPSVQIKYQYGLTETVACDFGRISQVVSNLLSNAVNHGMRGHPVSIEGLIEENNFIMKFINRGVQIENLNSLFRPFIKGKNNKCNDGLGLGLYICSEIVKAHNGHLQVESSENFTTFTLKLPLTSSHLESK